VTGALAALAANASLEISVRELGDVAQARGVVSPGQLVYVAHPPAQPWSETERACRVLRDAGLEPVPHVPARLVEDSAELVRLIRSFVAAGARAALFISGDQAGAAGSYQSVADVLRDPALRDAGLERVSLAGHPEGHPRVPLAAIRRAEREKAELAAAAGLQATLVGQFAFEAEPILAWARELGTGGVPARLVAGLAGPAKASTLFKYAQRCGIGPSIRALGDDPPAVEESPLGLMRSLAQARDSRLDGLHIYCFGGFLRTARWLREVASGALG